jgi:hypothetical protein
MNTTTLPAAALCTVAPQSLSLLEGIRIVFRGAGERLLSNPTSYEDVTREARARIGALLNGYQSSGAAGDPLAYPVRASRRFLEGEPYSPTRLRALERHLLRQESYLKGLRTSFPTSVPSPLAGSTIPSPSVTMAVPRSPSFEDCLEMIERLTAESTTLPPELEFIDLTGGEICVAREKNRVVAGKVIDLPMRTVLERIFSRVFNIGRNEGDFPGFWVEGVKVTPSLPEADRPAVRISCDLASIDELQAFVLAVRTMLHIPNPIEILLEGRFEWLGGALYIPMKPVRLSENMIPPDVLFGTATPILAPLGEDRTAFALDLEDKMLSKNPDVFIAGIAQGLR